MPNPETIAAHSHGTALIALALGPAVDPPLDVERAATLCVLHDAPECLSGDLPRPASEALPPGVKRDLEAALADRVLGPLSDLAREAFAEVQELATREARFAKACDRLHLGVRWLGYRRAGLGRLAEFRATLESADLSEFPPAESLRLELLAAAGER